jgi:hypothetical protein
VCTTLPAGFLDEIGELVMDVDYERVAYALVAAASSRAKIVQPAGIIVSWQRVVKGGYFVVTKGRGEAHAKS